jgi:hypothetical protein
MSEEQFYPEVRKDGDDKPKYNSKHKSIQPGSLYFRNIDRRTYKE